MEGLKQTPDADILGNSLHIPVLVSSSSASCKRNPHDHVKISAIITSFYQHQLLLHGKAEDIQNLPQMTQNFCSLLFLKIRSELVEKEKMAHEFHF